MSYKPLNCEYKLFDYHKLLNFQKYYVVGLLSWSHISINRGSSLSAWIGNNY